MANQLELLADRLADTLETGPVPNAPMNRRELVLSAAALVRRHGAADALGLLRLTLGSQPGYHDTETVFVVWAVDRLLAGGLSLTALCWHPLVAPGSELAWWDLATFRSAEAARAFVAPTRFDAGDPVPAEPSSDLALAS